MLKSNQEETKKLTENNIKNNIENANKPTTFVHMLTKVEEKDQQIENYCFHKHHIFCKHLS